jgi:hypothetical protein
MPASILSRLRYYFILGSFRAKEHFTDWSSNAIAYVLYCFFIWVLAFVWSKFKMLNSDFDYDHVFYYIGVTELLFMTFLSSRSIVSATEDFSLSLVRPRSWIAREIVANLGSCIGKRLLYFFALVVFSQIMRVHIEDFGQFIFRLFILMFLLALPQALLSTLFSALRLSFPQTDYFILPFGKLFLSLGGVFGPLSDYGEPYKTWLLKLPGSDLFFQPAYFAVFGKFYQSSIADWLMRIIAIQIGLFLLLLFFYRRGRRNYQAWGG